MQLSRGVRGLPFKLSPSVCTKTFYNLLRESTHVFVSQQRNSTILRKRKNVCLRK